MFCAAQCAHVAPSLVVARSACGPACSTMHRSVSKWACIAEKIAGVASSRGRSTASRLTQHSRPAVVRTAPHQLLPRRQARGGQCVSTDYLLGEVGGLQREQPQRLVVAGHAAPLERARGLPSPGLSLPVPRHVFARPPQLRLQRGNLLVGSGLCGHLGCGGQQKQPGAEERKRGRPRCCPSAPLFPQDPLLAVSRSTSSRRRAASHGSLHCAIARGVARSAVGKRSGGQGELARC